jgi:hypothetical protein
LVTKLRKLNSLPRTPSFVLSRKIDGNKISRKLNFAEKRKKVDFSYENISREEAAVEKNQTVFFEGLPDFSSYNLPKTGENIPNDITNRVSRFFLVHDTKTRKNAPNEHKISQMVIKYSNCL